MKRAISLAVFSLLAAATAGAADLMSVYRDALANDPTIRQADALRKATQEQKPQAWANLLPQIRGQGTSQRGQVASSSCNPFPLTDELGNVTGGILNCRSQPTRPDQRNWSINLTQNLFSWTNWATLKAADSAVA